jgi:hypothetical protein
MLVAGLGSVSYQTYSDRLYPFSIDVRAAYLASIDYATWMSSIWKASDFAGCKITAGTGDVTPLDAITFPCKKMSVTTVTRSETAIADVVSQALAHGCTYVGLNYEEAVSAATILGYFEADQPVVVAAGLKCVCIPIRSVLATLMGNADAAARLLAVTEFIYMQTQTLQTNPNDGSYATNVSSLVDTIRTRTTSMPIFIQASTEQPSSAIPASEVIAQVESVKNLDLNNGGFTCWYAALRWSKMQTVIQTLMADVSKFSS